MVETAAHLTDHVLPRLPVRHWVLPVPKRLRYFMQRDGATPNMVLRIFPRVIAQMLQANSPGAAHANKAALHTGAVAFIHRFGSSPNEHVHFHVCVVDGVLEAVVGEAGGQGTRTTATSVMFHPATGIACEAVAQAQASLRGRILRAFVGRGLLEGFEAQEMLGSKHSGFSVATSVCIAALDRAGLERLLRCCARPAFALDRLRKAGRELIYRCAKQQREPGSGQRDHRNAKRGVKHRAQADELHLTPLELIARLATLVPPPRAHRHRYCGALAPHSLHRAAAVAVAQAAGPGQGQGQRKRVRVLRRPSQTMHLPPGRPRGQRRACSRSPSSSSPCSPNARRTFCGRR